MSFNFTEEHEKFREKAQKIIEREIAPYTEEWNKKNSISRKAFEAAAKLKIGGILVPKEKGGLGLDFSYSYIFAQELVKTGDLSILSSLMIQANTVCPLLARYGTDYIVDKFLKPIINGELIAGIAVSEPSGGSDILSAIQCYAEETDNGWILNGEKMYITNSPIADVLIVFCRTKKINSPLSMSFIVVPTNLPGIEIEDLKKLGQNGSQIGRIVFKDCKVPLENLVGKKNQGYLFLNDVFQEERLVVAAAAVSVGKYCLNEAIKYVKNKKYDTDKFLYQHQIIKYQLAELSAEISACQSFVDDIVRTTIENGSVDKIKVSMAKYAVVEKVQRIIRRCSDFYGKNGLYKESYMEQLIRDIVVLNVYAGTAETMKELVAKSIKKIYG